jgi:TatD DNase family protein
MELIDTHCHLNFNAFKGGFLEAVKRAKQASVSKIIIPGSNIENSQSAIDTTADINEKFGESFGFAGIGIHPVHVEELEKFSEIEKLSDKAVAVGECGFDFYHDKEKKTTIEQAELLQKHFDLAVKTGLPLIFHNRDADAEVLEFLDRQKTLPKIVFHCFSTNWRFAQVVLEKGFYLSFTGNITYGNKDIKKVIERAPLEKIMIETDAPYIVPEPLRSEGIKPNEPAYVIEVAKKIALIKNISVEEVATATTKNAEEFFGI